MTNNNQLSTRTKVVYGLGDFASQLVWTFVGNYLTIFYTDVVGLAPAIASAIILIARVLDGVIDPIFGAIAERTKSKYGRFRPYILYGAPVLAVFNVLTFTSPFGGGRGGIIWASFTYIVLGIIYTVVNLSYGSLANVMTTEPQERVELNSWRLIGTNLGACFLSAISMPLILKFSGVGDGATVTSRGYIYTTAFFAICSLPLFFFVFRTCKEVIMPIHDVKNVSILKTFQIVIVNKPLVLIFFTMLFFMTGMFGRIGLAIYYFIYNMQRYDLIAMLMMAPTICAAISIFFTRKLVNYISKKLLGVISLVGCAMSLVGLYLAPPTNATLVILLSSLYGLFMFGTPLFMGSVPECIDYQEDESGVRADGTSYAFVSLATKLGSAFGSSIGLMIMAAFGYIANSQQSQEALKGINVAVNLLPAGLFLLSLIPWLLYPITKEKNLEIRKRLDEKASQQG